MIKQVLFHQKSVPHLWSKVILWRLALWYSSASALFTWEQQSHSCWWCRLGLRFPPWQKRGSLLKVWNTERLPSTSMHFLSCFSWSHWLCNTVLNNTWRKYVLHLISWKMNDLFPFKVVPCCLAPSHFSFQLSTLGKHLNSRAGSLKTLIFEISTFFGTES